MYARVSIHAYVCMEWYTHVYTQVSTHICIHGLISTHMCAWLSAHICVHWLVHMCTHGLVHVHGYAGKYTLIFYLALSAERHSDDTPAAKSSPRVHTLVSNPILQ